MVRVEQFLADQVAARGDAPALSDSTGVRWTYKMFDKASDDIAQALKDAGVQPNDRVLMLSENCAAAVATVFGTWKAGAVIIPVNARQSAGESLNVRMTRNIWNSEDFIHEVTIRCISI